MIYKHIMYIIDFMIVFIRSLLCVVSVYLCGYGDIIGMVVDIQINLGRRKFNDLILLLSIRYVQLCTSYIFSLYPSIYHISMSVAII